jgi:MFS family permease
VQLGILTTAVQVAKAVPMLVLSLRGRPLSGRLPTIAGLMLIAVPLFIFPFLTEFSLLVVCQAVIGLGVGIAFPVLMGLALQAVEPEARASAMGVFQSVYAIGMTLGPAVSGLVARRWDITAVYMSNGALLVTSILVAVVLLRQPRAVPEPLPAD